MWAILLIEFKRISEKWTRKIQIKMIRRLLLLVITKVVRRAISMRSCIQEVRGLSIISIRSPNFHIFHHKRSRRRASLRRNKL